MAQQYNDNADTKVDNTFMYRPFNMALPEKPEKNNLTLTDAHQLIRVPGFVQGIMTDMVLDSGASMSVISRNIVERYKFPLKPAPESWKLSLADGTLTETCAWMTEPLDVCISNKYCNLSFVVVAHDRIDLLLGLDWMRKNDARIFINSIFVLRFPAERIKWYDREQRTVMALTNKKSAVIQIDPHQLMSVLSTAAADVLGIKICYDRFNKPEIDTFFELAFQARRIRVAKIQVKDDVGKFIILGQDIIELFDIEVDEDDTSRMYFRENKIRSEENPEEDDDEFMISLAEICIDEEGMESDLTWTLGNEIAFNIETEEFRSRIEEFLAKNSTAFATDYEELGECTVRKHTIKTESETPIFLPPYRKSINERAAIKEEIDKMLKAKVIRPSNSPYRLQVVMVPKKNGTKRICIDYRKLNQITTQDPFPLPRID